MNSVFDFSGIDKSEIAIRNTWSEFREALANGVFTYDEVDKAKKYIFLKQYDDLFHQHSGIEHTTVCIKDVKKYLIGRGTNLDDSENPDYERFIPKEHYIKYHNRFSPPGVEWLYLAIGETEEEIHNCAQAECRAKPGNKFGFCHFAFDIGTDDLKLIDLTIADASTYDSFNSMLEEYAQNKAKKVIEKAVKIAKATGYIPDIRLNRDEVEKIFTKWGVYTYSKLLSEQIFVPLSETDDKGLMYAPFQTMAQYYISLGYSGIIYGSTVSSVGKNIVLFDKSLAHPMGKIETYRIR